MSSNQSRYLYEASIEVDCCLAWDIYRRLHELGIPCHKNSYEPLQVALTTPPDFVQTWCVCVQHMQSRNVLISWLEHCWSYSVPEPRIRK